MSDAAAEKSRPSAKFPRRVFTQDEVGLARTLIDQGYKHRLRILGSQRFREKAREALRLVKKAGYYDFLRTYIGKIRRIDGLSQLREAEASIWANDYAVEEAVDAACFFVQKAWQMKAYVEGEAYYGPQGEAKAADVRLEFLRTLKRKTGDLKIKEECQRRMRIQQESVFL